MPEFLIDKERLPNGFRESLYSKYNNQFSLSEMSELQATYSSSSNEQRELYSVRDGAAYISISGVLIPKQDWWLDYLEIDNTVYSDLIDAIKMAENDPSVGDTIYFPVCTPGGYVEGSDLAAEAIANCSKKTVVLINDYCCSAGVKLASQADHINAVTRGVRFGSIGTKVQVQDYSEWEKSVGISTFELTNSSSPDKAPDVSTDHGKEVIVDGLDESQEVFESYLIEGYSRNSDFSIEKVRSLKGRVVSAKKAMSIGMIDSIGKLVSVDIKPVAGEVQQSAMDNSGGSVSSDEEKDLQSVLSENPVAQKQYDDSIAEIKASATKQAEEKIGNMKSILKMSGVKLSDDAQKAIDSGMDHKDFAVQQMETFAKGGSSDPLPKLEAAHKVEDDVVEEEKPLQSNNEVDAMASKRFGKNKG